MVSKEVQVKMMDRIIHDINGLEIELSTLKRRVEYYKTGITEDKYD